MSITRINTKSQPINNQPKNAMKNKMRIILPALIGRVMEKFYRRLSCFGVALTLECLFDRFKGYGLKYIRFPRSIIVSNTALTKCVVVVI